MTLPVSIESNISVAERDRRCAVKKKSIDKTAMGVKKLKTALGASNCLGGTDGRPLAGDIERLGIITNYDFVNIEHPSATSAIHSTITKHNPPRTPKSPAIADSYATSMVNTPIMLQSSYPPPLQHPHHRQEYPSGAVLNYHKPSYSYDSMNSQPSGHIVSSALSEYDQAYTPNSDSPYSLSSSPSGSSTYDDMVSSAYLPPSSLTATSSMPSYAPLITSTHPGPQFMNGHNVHQHRNHQWGDINLQQQQVSAAAGNLPDNLYSGEMLGTF